VSVFLIEETMDKLKARADGCQVWQDALMAPTPEGYGDYPTLVLSGQLGSLAPPAWAETAAAAIPQAQHVPTVDPAADEAKKQAGSSIGGQCFHQS
jgi:hypothetical protein